MAPKSKEKAPAASNARMASFLASEAIKKLQDPKGSNVFIGMASEFNIQVAKIPTGVFPIDWALDGGIPTGKFSHIYGLQGSFKSGIATRTVGNAQQLCATCYHPTPHGRLAREDWVCKCGDMKDMICAYLDIEGTYDKPWGAAQGVDNDRLILALPDSLEDAADATETFIYQGADVIVLDSLAFMSPQKEIDSDMDQDLPGIQSRLLRRAIRKWTTAVRYVLKTSGRRCTVLMVNQVTSKIGIVYGSPESIPGGSGPRFASSVELKMLPKLTATELEQDTGGSLPTTTPLEFRIEKNKLGGARMEGDFVLNLKNNPVTMKVAEEKAADEKGKPEKGKPEKGKKEKKQEKIIGWKRKGEITDEPFIMAILKKVGLISATRPYQICGGSFENQDAVEVALYTNPRFKQAVVAKLLSIRTTLETSSMAPEEPELEPVPEDLAPEDAG